MAFGTQPPKNWGNLEGIPLDLTDGKISWAEVINKPNFPVLENNNTFSGSTQQIDPGMGSNVNAGFRLLSGGVTDYRGFAIVANTSGNFFINQIADDGGFQKSVLFSNRDGLLRLYYNGSIRLETTDNGVRVFNLPTASTGLPSSHLWRDSNGFLRIVP